VLIQETLWGRQDKVKIAVDRMQSFVPAEGYYLAFSGGKDSVVIYQLALMAGVRFDAHYNVTTVDPPELTRFIKDHYPDVLWNRPEMSMFQLILKVQFWPPMRQQRWCCEILKEKGGDGRIVLTGIRWEESNKRRSRRMIEPCYKDVTKTYFHPIIDWSTRDVWEFIDLYSLPYCKLYDMGFHRLGCILCPYRSNPKRDIEQWPKFAKAYIRTFDRLLLVRAAQGKETSFRTGQEFFDWWIRRNTKRKSRDQLVLDI